MLITCVAWLLLSSGGPDPETSTRPWTLADAELPRSLRADLAVESQEVVPVPVDDPQKRPSNDDLTVVLGANVRFSIPFGAANRDYYYYGGFYAIDHYSSWSDFFNPGWGIDVEANIFFTSIGPGRRRAKGSNYGLVLLAQADQYDGRSVSDGFGNKLRVEDLNMNTIQIGGKFIQAMEGDFFLDGTFAVGAVHYSAVEGTYTGLLGNTIRDEVFKDTWTFASTFKGDAGVHFGPLGLVLGLNLRILAPPSDGTRVDLDSGAFWTFDINLGVVIGF